MLALGFLLVIGMTLIADGFGAHVPKGCVYAAMAFSALIEGLNMLSRRARRKQATARETAVRKTPEAGTGGLATQGVAWRSERDWDAVQDTSRHSRKGEPGGGGSGTTPKRHR